MMTEATKERLEVFLDEMVEGLGRSEAECLLLLDAKSGTDPFDEVVVHNLHGEVEYAENAFLAERGVDRQVILSEPSEIDGLGRLALVNHIDRLGDRSYPVVR